MQIYAEDFKKYAEETLKINKINFNVLELPKHYSIKSIPTTIKQYIPEDNMFYSLISKNPMPDWELTFDKIISNIDNRRKQLFAENFQELNSILRKQHG